ncbi:MAG: hypothetical protein PUD22_05145 [Erysipelotrichaceae bacterium]|nr:hypothetical protein [Erysipelotrichaceae bacterium]
MFANLSLGTKILYGVSAVLLVAGVGYLALGMYRYFKPVSIFKKAEEVYVHARLVKKRKIIKKQKDRSAVQLTSVKDYNVFQADFLLDDGSVLMTTIGEWNYGRYHVGDTGTLGYKPIGEYGNIFCDFDVEIKSAEEDSQETIETKEE